MSADQKSKSRWNVVRATRLLLAVGAAVVPAAYAGAGAKATPGTAVNVVAHVEVASGAATQLQLTKSHGKQYLSIGAAGSSQLVLVDVSHAAEPRVVDGANLSGAKTIATAAETLGEAPEILAQLNMSDASKAGMSHQFASSARFVADEKRGLIYVLDGDGLWIVKTQAQREESAGPDFSIYG